MYRSRPFASNYPYAKRFKSNYKRPAFQSSAASRAAKTSNRRVLKGPRTRGTLTQQVKSLQTVVKKLSPELKHLDINVDVTNLTNTGAVVHLTALTQGDDFFERVGSTVNVLSITFGGIWVRTASTYGDNGAYRVVLFCDKEQVGDTNPTMGAVMQNPSLPELPLPATALLERFRIMWVSPLYEQKRMALGTALTTNVPTQSAAVLHTWNGGIKVSFNGAASTDQDKNGIYLGFLSNDTTDVVDFDGLARVSYTDV